MALLPFVTARDPACKADAQRVGERSAQETFQFNRIEPAVGQRSTGRQVAGGLGRDIVDRAAGCILAEQRAMRPLEHFKPIEIERGQRCERRERERHLIKIDADRSEEHTSELQSLMRISYAVLCLKTKNTT